jgi:arylsulfatase
MPRPNLLLITTDQQRFDAMGINGNEHLQTPVLDHLAATGVNFQRAYVTCPSCIAARRTILTGQSGATHGLVGYRDGEEFFPKFTLPGLLRDAGYQTQLIGKLHQFPQRKRYGFDHMIVTSTPGDRPDSAWLNDNDYVGWLKQAGVLESTNAHGINGNSRLARPWHMAEQYHHTNYLTSEAIEFMTHRRDPSQPFFLHLSYWAPHPPLVPPQVYYDRYVNNCDLKPRIGSWAPQGTHVPAGIAPDSAVGPFRADVIQNAMAGYYGLVNHIDDQIQQLIEAYYVYGGPRSKDPLWIVFTSDHGEMLGDHHLFRKSLGYEGSAHIPFFITGRNVPLKKASSQALVCLEDLLPTFMDLAGAPIPDGIDGKSLKPLMTGEATAVRDEIHGEHSGVDNHFIVHGRHKYMWFAKTNEEQLFDLENDPYELQDISANLEILAGMRQRLAARLKNRKDYTYDVTKLKPLCNATPKAFWKDGA